MDKHYLDLPVIRFDKSEFYQQDGNIHYIFALPYKENGQFIMRLKSNMKERLIAYFADSVFRYGPTRSVIHTRLKLDVISNSHVLVCQSSTIISAGFIHVHFPKDIQFDLVEAEFTPKLYAYENKGQFCSDNVLLNDIYKASLHTIHMCTMSHSQSYATHYWHESPKAIPQWHCDNNDFVLMDGPRRDREVWIGDLLYEFRTSWYGFGDKTILRNSLMIAADQQQSCGYLPSSSVSLQHFKEYDCWFLVVLWEYVLFTGDVDTVRQLRHCYIEVLLTIEGNLSSDHFMNLGTMQTWAWTLSRSGYVTSTQCILVRCYRCAALLEKLLGYNENAHEYEKLAQKISMNINSHAFDYDVGAYRNVADGKNAAYSLDANMLAILFGVSDRSKSERALSFVKEHLYSPFGSHNLYPKEPLHGNNWCHNRHIWPFAVNFELDARFFMSDYSGAMDLLRRCWGTMLSHGSRTFWEYIDGDDGTFGAGAMQNILLEGDFWNSYSHGWSAGAGYSIAAYIAGIRPTKPGFEEFIISLPENGPGFMNASVPTPRGEIILQTQGSDVAHIYVPEGCTATFTHSTKSVILHSGDNSVHY